MCYPSGVMAIEETYPSTPVRIWDRTLSKLDELAKALRRRSRQELLDVIVDDALVAQGIDPHTLTKKPDPATQPVETAS